MTAGTTAGTAGAAGTGDTAGTTGGTDMMDVDAGMPPVNPMGMEPPDDGIPYAMDECDLNSGFPGDELCILPPPPDKGFQIHIGPTDYNNPGQFLLEGGDEATVDFPAVSSNTSNVHFLFRQFRFRPGVHHMIATANGGGGGDPFGRRIATANLSQDSPAGGKIAPENQGVGIPIAANTPVNVSLHAINITDQPQIREIWVNFWYRDEADVTEEATQLFAPGSMTFVVQPHEDTILGPFNCNVSGTGRMLWFYGHRHANNVRFSAWRIRGAQRDLFYEGLHWEEPLLLEYNSIVTNPVPNQAMDIEGGWSGVLDLMPGDKLEWECHVINKLDTPLRFTNNTYTGEMCIMDAEMVGTTCSSGLGFP